MPYLEPLSPALQAACNSSDVAEVRVLSKGLTRGEWSSLLTSATDAGAVEVAAYCLEQGATINYETLYSAAWNAKSEPVYRYMIESGATDVTYPNVFIDRGGDVLGLAADAARHSLVRFMLERGATPNTSLEFRAGRPTLVCAARNSDKEMVELLLDHGANLHGRGVLVAAAGAGKADTVDFLLSRGVDVNEQENRSYLDGPERPINETALHRAARHGHKDVIGRLLQAGADVRIKNNDGQTAGDVADNESLDASTQAMLRAE